jgi:hypothetical protein
MRLKSPRVSKKNFWLKVIFLTPKGFYKAVFCSGLSPSW